MVARSENLDRTVDELKAANCLMLLTKIGECHDGGDRGKENRLFRCKTCFKEFTSFQALGGHRASHNKPTMNGEDHSLKKIKPMTSHTCPICGLEFPMGQALGGHMRRHRNEKDKATSELVTRSFWPEETWTTTLKKSTSNVKRVACLDLGPDLVDGNINLKLELGRSLY